MSVAIRGKMRSKADKHSYDELFEAILPDSIGPSEMGHNRTATASCYLPCHTARKPVARPE